jgi:thioredoxin reductase
VRDRKLAVYAKNKDGSELALMLKGWSIDVILLTDGRKKLKAPKLEELKANDIDVITLPVQELKHEEGKMKELIFRDGSSRKCDALFFVNGYTQQCNLAEAFGCEVSRKGVIITNRFQQTNIEGLYVAGDAARDMHFVVVAAAEGAKAGVIINKELQRGKMRDEG